MIMESDIYLTDQKIQLDPQWEWCIGGDWHSMTYRVIASPHFLGRILQKYLLDIHWRKIK